MAIFNTTTITDVTTIVAITINMMCTNFFKVIQSSGFPKRLFRLGTPSLQALDEMVFPKRTRSDCNSTQK